MSHPSPPVIAAPPAGWYPDPWRVAPWRWWDGQGWTPATAPAAASWPAPARPGEAGPHRSTLDKLRRRGDDPAYRGLGAAAIGALGALAASFGVAVVGPAVGIGLASPIGVIVAMAALWLPLLAAVAHVSRRRGSGSITADFGLWPLRPADIGVGAAIGFLTCQVSAMIAVAVQTVLGGPATHHLRNPGLGLFAVVALCACVGAPIVEELFCRGLLQGALTRRFGPAAAITVQALLFAAAHLNQHPGLGPMVAAMAAIGTGGAILGWLRHWSGRVGPGVVAHATLNTIVFVTTGASLVGRHLAG